MATANKSLNTPANGSNVNVWDQPVNSNWGYLDSSLGGVTSLSVSAGSATLTSSPANPNSPTPAQTQALIFNVSGTLTASVVYTIPAGVGGEWIVNNQAVNSGTNTYTVTFQGSSTTGVIIPNGSVRSIYNDPTSNVTSFSSPQSSISSSNNQVIYQNNSGSIVGSANLTFDGTTLTANTASVTGAITAGGVIKSTSGGFTFPDNSTQTTASGVSGIIPGVFSSLKITASSLTVSVTANYVALFNGTGFYTAAAPSLTIAANTTGANGLDTGTLATNWYSVWVIYNPTTTTVAGLLSLSATAPTLPSGYTFKARVGWVRAASGSALVNTVQYGNSATYVTPAQVFSGSNSNTVTSYSLTTIVPATASAVGLILTSANADNQNAPRIGANSSLGLNSTSATVPPFLSISGQGGTSIAYSSISVLMPLQSLNVYYASISSSLITSYGWTDNL